MPRDNNESDENENGEKWAFFFVVFAIISLQFLLAVALGSVVVSVSKLPHFVLHTAPGLAIYILSIVFCLIRRGKTVLEAVILMSAVAVVLTFYSMWSMIVERKFSSGELFLIGIIVVASVYIPVQVCHPFAKLSTSIYACLVALSFCGRLWIAGNLFIKYQFYDPIGAAVIIHLFFLLNNPDRRELTGRG